ncbi:MAG: hypothetical protein C0407_15880 [Desulfobacca sp.]|nr:hypothetical protein [Desulfobacca sp.]
MKKSPLKLTITMTLCLFLAAGCAGLREKMRSSGQSGSLEDEIKSFFISAGSLHLRACPGLNCQILTTLKRGEEVLKISEEGEWMKVQVKAARIEGWVASRFVSSKPLKPIMPSSPGSSTSKPQEEWAAPDKGTKPPPSLPKEDFAK